MSAEYAHNTFFCCMLSSHSHFLGLLPLFAPLHWRTTVQICLTQREPLPAAPGRWQLVTVAAIFFSFTPCPVSLLSFCRLQPMVLGLTTGRAWCRAAPHQPQASAACCLQPGSRKTWIPSRSSTWHLRWNFPSLLQFSSCSEEDTILNALAMCSLPHGSFTYPCVRAALLFKTIAPNLGLFPQCSLASV